MAIYTDITFGDITLRAKNINAKKVQKTRKSVIGKTLIETDILGMGDQQWELDIEGVIVESGFTALSSAREDIEGLNDVDTHTYVDGMHDGTFYLVPGSLVFDDSGDQVQMFYTYRMKLVEQ